MSSNEPDPGTDNESDPLLRIAHRLENFVVLTLVVTVGFITLLAMTRLGFGLYDTVFDSRAGAYWLMRDDS